MTATATRTPAEVASWGTWKDHGHAAVLGYMGRDRKSAGMVVRTVTAAMAGQGLELRSTKNNELVARMGPAGKFWAVVAPAETAQVPQPRKEQEPTGDAKAIQAAAKAARPGRNAKLHDCECGCSAQVRGLYKQGHNARHAGDVARKAIAAGADADLTAILAELPTAALQAKAARMIASRVK
jgi:hypothetical protein